MQKNLGEAMAIVTHFVSAALLIQNILAQRQGTPVECPTECLPCHNGCSSLSTIFNLDLILGRGHGSILSCICELLALVKGVILVKSGFDLDSELSCWTQGYA